MKYLCMFIGDLIDLSIRITWKIHSKIPKLVSLCFFFVRFFFFNFILWLFYLNFFFGLRCVDFWKVIFHFYYTSLNWVGYMRICYKTFWFKMTYPKPISIVIKLTNIIFFNSFNSLRLFYFIHYYYILYINKTMVPKRQTSNH